MTKKVAFRFSQSVYEYYWSEPSTGFGLGIVGQILMTAPIPQLSFSFSIIRLFIAFPTTLGQICSHIVCTAYHNHTYKQPPDTEACRKPLKSRAFWG